MRALRDILLALLLIILCSSCNEPAKESLKGAEKAQANPLTPWAITLGSNYRRSIFKPSEIFRGVDSDTRGNIYVVGSFRGSSKFRPSNQLIHSKGEEDIVIAKVASDGTLIWHRNFGGKQFDQALNVCSGPASLYVVGLYTDDVAFDEHTLLGSVANNTAQGFLLKLDPINGQVVWARTVGQHIQGQSRSGAQVFSSIKTASFASECAVNADGQITVSGAFGGYAGSTGTQVAFNTEDPEKLTAQFDGMVINYSQQGHINWVQRTYGMTSDTSNRFRALVADKHGGWYVGGRFEGSIQLGSTILVSAGKRDGFVGRVSANGTWLWARAISGPGHDDVRGLAMLDTDLVIGGSFSDTAAVFTPNTRVTSQGRTDVVVARSKDNGDLVWTRTLGGAGRENGLEVDVTADGGIIIAGSFASPSIEFGAHRISNQSSVAKFSWMRLFSWLGFGFDQLIAKLDKNGTPESILAVAGGPGVDASYSISTLKTPEPDSESSYVVAGFLQGHAKFGDLSLTAHGIEDALLIQIK